MKKILLIALLTTSFSAFCCHINLKVKNKGSNEIQVNNRPYADLSAVKVSGGTWKSLRSLDWRDNSSNFSLFGGDVAGDNLNVSFGCNKKRRYQIRYYCLQGKYSGSTFYAYYPSPTGWTTSQNITVNLKLCE